MRIGKRLFPYPILNNDRLYSQFKSSTFALEYEEMVTEETYSLQDLKCEITSEFLIQLIKEEKAQIVIVVECASTMFRHHYTIPLEPSKIIIPISDLNGKVTVSAYVVATQNIDDYSCKDFLDDYEDYSFSIEKNDILAVDDGFTNKIEFDENEDTKKSSIFVVIKDKTIKDETMRIDYDSSKVIIYLPEEQWNTYEKTKRIGKFQNLYFSVLAIPALVYAIQDLGKKAFLLDQLRMDYSWFNAFLVSYKNINGHELTDEEFLTMNAYLEVQKLMNYPVTKALDDIFNLTITFGGNDDAD